MSAYPPEWQIHSESEFEAFHLAPGEDGAMGMVLQAKLNRSGNFNGVFQCCIFRRQPHHNPRSGLQGYPGPP